MFLNASFPTLDLVSFDVLIVTAANFLLPENASLPIFVSFVEETVMLVSAVQFLKAAFPMLCRDFESKTSFFNALHPLKALFSIFVILDAPLTVFNSVHL